MIQVFGMIASTIGALLCGFGSLSAMMAAGEYHDGSTTRVRFTCWAVVLLAVALCFAVSAGAFAVRVGIERNEGCL